MNYRSILLTALATVSTSSFAGGFVNGSFEDGINAPTTGYRQVTYGAADQFDITGWNPVKFGTDAYNQTDWVGTYWQASDGTRSMDLSGGTRGGVSQFFDTVAGQNYTVSFDLSGNPEGGNAVKTMGYLATDGLGNQLANGSFTYDTATMGNTESDMKWVRESYSFTATSATSGVWFLSGEQNAWGPALDNVNVTPEPASLAALAIGGLSLLRKRRRA